MAKTPPRPPRWSRRQSLIAKATQDPAYMVDKYMSLLGKYAAAKKP